MVRLLLASPPATLPAWEAAVRGCGLPAPAVTADAAGLATAIAEAAPPDLLVVDPTLWGDTAAAAAGVRALRAACPGHPLQVLLVARPGLALDALLDAGVDDLLSPAPEAPDLSSRLALAQRRLGLVRRRAREDILAAHPTLFDPETGAARSLLVRDHLDRALLRANRTGDGVAAVLVELDLAAEGGPAPLSPAAQQVLAEALVLRIRSAVRRYDVVGLEPGPAALIALFPLREADALVVAQRVSALVGATPLVHEGRRVHLRPVLGVAYSDGSGPMTRGDQLIDAAGVKVVEARALRAGARGGAPGPRLVNAG